ncbi:type II secretion system F family protein [Plantactinospora alkalitolerans]|uniref:type II secretion system F family protein n=1 Tax=Plantactinospora alkalitolerans TaxID=2789879 RepID=UPI00389AA9ED
MARTALPLVLVGIAVLVATAGGRVRRPSRQRLSELRGEGWSSPATPPAGAGSSGGSSAGGGLVAVDRSWPGRPRWMDLVRLGAGLGGLAAAVVLGGWPGVLVGVLTAVGLDRLLRRFESAAVRRHRLRAAADLPLAADLLAAALRAGAPVDRAVSAVAEALAGPLGERLEQVGRTLRLGGSPDEAWPRLGPVPGAERLTRAAVRSSASGAALAGALTRLADDLRADRVTTAEAAARRAGVLIVLPLGLCFLPAFILAGLVPVIVAVLGDVL